MALYVHCMYGYVRTLYVRTRTSKKLSLRMLSVPNPFVRACTYNVHTLYLHLLAGMDYSSVDDADDGDDDQYIKHLAEVNWYLNEQSGKYFMAHTT